MREALGAGRAAGGKAVPMLLARPFRRSGMAQIRLSGHAFGPFCPIFESAWRPLRIHGGNDAHSFSATMRTFGAHGALSRLTAPTDPSRSRCVMRVSLMALSPRTWRRRAAMAAPSTTARSSAPPMPSVWSASLP